MLASLARNPPRVRFLCDYFPSFWSVHCKINWTFRGILREGKLIIANHKSRIQFSRALSWMFSLLIKVWHRPKSFHHSSAAAVFVPSKHVHSHSIYNLFIKTIFMAIKSARNSLSLFEMPKNSLRRPSKTNHKVVPNSFALPENYAIINYLCTRQLNIWERRKKVLKEFQSFFFLSPFSPLISNCLATNDFKLIAQICLSWEAWQRIERLITPL